MGYFGRHLLKNELAINLNLIDLNTYNLAQESAQRLNKVYYKNYGTDIDGKGTFL